MRSPLPIFRHFLCKCTAAALLVSSALAVPVPLLAQLPVDHSAASTASDMERHIAEAALRFGVPPHWVRAVIAVESGGEPRAVSRAGAMGLMQVMPGTWAELRAAHGLGSDPFDARDNILAGTAYLRAMYDRFGSPGFLAAYNAGPARYAEHLATGRPLPRETHDYLATLAPMIGEETPQTEVSRTQPTTADWREAPLFAGAADARPDSTDAAEFGRVATASTELFMPLQTRKTP